MTDSKITTGVVRLSYANLFEPVSSKEGKPKKYSTATLIKKTDTVTVDRIKTVVKALCEEFKAKNKGKLPANFKLPLRDGDEERGDDENYEGCYFLNCSSNNKPGIFDKNREVIVDKDEVYSGCFAHVIINLYLFDVEGNRGIACGLNGVMKVKDGDRLSGGASTADDFAAVTVGEDDDEWLK